MPVSSASVDLARRLLVLESGQGGAGCGGAGGGADGPEVGSPLPPVRVFVKLQAILCRLAGTTGCRSLLARAVTLAQAQDSSLADVRVLEDGSLSGIDQLGRGGAEAAAGVLLAQVLDLLIIFIGITLLLQLLRGEWPDVSLGTSGGKRET